MGTLFTIWIVYFWVAKFMDCTKHSPPSNKGNDDAFGFPIPKLRENSSLYIPNGLLEAFLNYMKPNILTNLQSNNKL